MRVQSYKDLIVWQKSMELVLLVYKLTAEFPRSEMFGLSSQLRRSAYSIPSNIAEGWTRKHLGEYIQFLYIAAGSAAELETQLILSKKLDMGDNLSYARIEGLLLEV